MSSKESSHEVLQIHLFHFQNNFLLYMLKMYYDDDPEYLINKMNYNQKQWCLDKIIFDKDTFYLIN